MWWCYFSGYLWGKSGTFAKRISIAERVRLWRFLEKIFRRGPKWVGFFERVSTERIWKSLELNVTVQGTFLHLNIIIYIISSYHFSIFSQHFMRDGELKASFITKRELCQGTWTWCSIPWSFVQELWCLS